MRWAVSCWYSLEESHLVGVPSFLERLHQKLLELRDPAVKSPALEEDREIPGEPDRDIVLLVLAFLGVRRLGELDIDALVDEGRDHHEDDQEHDHDVGHGRHVDLRDRTAFFSAD